MDVESYIRTEGLSRTYQRGPQVVHALQDVSIGARRGDFLSIVGSSGSGKTTLLNLIAGLDTPTSGMVEIDGVDLSSLSRRQLAAHRGRKVGMIFQSFHLIPHYTALQNVETALYFNGTSPAERRRRAAEILEELGLNDRMTHRPADLSGGEQQRVAVARAVVKRPDILFADEPTGNLDFDNARQITALLASLNAGGLTIVMVTHNLDLAREFTRRTIRMHYGRVVEGDAGSLMKGDHP